MQGVNNLKKTPQGELLVTVTGLNSARQNIAGQNSMGQLSIRSKCLQVKMAAGQMNLWSK